MIGVAAGQNRDMVTIDVDSSVGIGHRAWTCFAPLICVERRRNVLVTGRTLFVPDDQTHQAGEIQRLIMRHDDIP